MNIKEEKQYIYQNINYLIQERRALTDEIHEWKKRLNELDKYERAGVDELSTTGYVDMRNQNEIKNKLENLTREKEFQLNNHNNNEEKENKVANTAIQEQKDYDTKKKSNYNDINRVQDIIINIMKELGRPAKTKEIYNELINRYEGKVTIQNFRNNILPRIYKHNKNIEKPTKGYYQYRAN